MIQHAAFARIVVTIMTLGCAAAAEAATCTAATGTVNWGTAATWSCGSVPANGDNVVIPSGATVILNVNTNRVNDLTVNAGGTLRGDNTNKVLTMNDGGGFDITNSGTIDFGAGNLATMFLREDSQWQGNAGTWNLSVIDLDGNTLTFAAGASMTLNMSGAAAPIINAGDIISLSTLTWNFAGTVAQTLPNDTNVSYGNITISNTTGVTLGVSLNATRILGNLTVAPNAILNNNALAITLAAGRQFAMQAGSRFNLTGTSTMVAVSGGGTKTFNATSTVNYGGASQLMTAETYGNLLLGGSATKTLAAGTTTIVGGFTLGTGVTYAGNTNNPTVNLAGNFSNSGTFTSGTGIFTFNGGAAQTLTGATTFTNMALNNTGASPWLTLGNNVTVGGTLTFTSGGITTGTNTVIISAGGSVARTSGHVVGNLQKNVALGAGIARTFEIGDAATYAPVSVTFASVTTAGNLVATTTSGDHPNTSTSPVTSGLDVNNSVNRYWTMTNSGIVFTTYSATFNYVAGDNDAGFIAANYVVAKGDTCSGAGAGRTCTAWSVPTAGAPGPSGTQATATGMASFGDFAVGQRVVNNFLISVSGSPVSTCSPTAVTITARNASNATITNYRGTVNLSTSVAHGDWTISAASGTLTPGAADSGAANYAFVAADNGSVILNLRNIHTDNLTITVTDALSGIASTSSPVSFTGNVFVITEDTIQVAGRNQAMTVQMLIGSACGVATSYTGPKNLDAWLTRDAADPGGAAPTIGALSVPSTAPASNPASNNLALTFSAGLASFNLATTDVGKYVLNIRDDTRIFATSADIGVASNSITTRPFAFGFTNIRQGALANPGGTAGAGAKFVAAEDVFEATVGAYLWSSADDVDNDGVPDAASNVTDNGLTPSFRWATTLSATTPITPTTGTTGTLGGSVNIALAGFVGGQATVADLTYTQVGSVTLRADAIKFLGSAVNVSGTSTPVGRFYPDHFALTASALTAACNGFTYMNQPALNFSYTLQAQGKANGLTSNYSAALAYPVAAVALVAENANAGTDIAPRITSAAAVWAAGQFTVSSPNSTFARLATPDGPYDALALGVRAVDADGAVIAGRDMNAATAGDCVTAANCDAKQIAGATTRARFGRLRISNGNGSQLIAMPLPIQTQYWNGSGFITSALDNCTTVAPANVALGNFQRNLSAGETTVTTGGAFVAGVGSLRLSAPGAANNGSVDVSVNLTAVPAGASCTTSPAMPASTGLGLTWLHGAWCGATYNRDPTARATFGVLRNTDRFIYQRENF